MVYGDHKFNHKHKHKPHEDPKAREAPGLAVVWDQMSVYTPEHQQLQPLETIWYSWLSASDGIDVFGSAAVLVPATAAGSWTTKYTHLGQVVSVTKTSP